MIIQDTVDSIFGLDILAAGIGNRARAFRDAKISGVSWCKIYTKIRTELMGKLGF